MTKDDLIKQLKGYDDDFAFFMPFVFDAENVYRRDGVTIAIERVPGDSGGETICGIDKASHPHFDFNDITPKNVCDVYFGEWKNEGIDELIKPFKFVYFDTCVNCGVGRAKSLRAKSGDDAKKFLDERADFYRRLASAKSVDRKFLRGWLNRIEDLRDFLGF